MPQSPSNKLFNERLRKMFEIIFVQFWHTRERATSSSLYLCTTFNYYKFSILLQTMIDFVWKCIWLFLRLTIKCCQSFFTRYIYIHISLKRLIYLLIIDPPLFHRYNVYSYNFSFLIRFLKNYTSFHQIIHFSAIHAFF